MPSKGPVLLVTLEYPPKKGGIATYLANLVAAMPDGSMRVLASKDGDTHEYDIAQSVPIFRRRLLSDLIRPRWLAALYWTHWVTRTERPSAIVVSHVLPLGMVARMMKRWHKVPYVVILHGMDIALALDAGGRKAKAAKAALADASLVVTNSMFTARLAESAGVPAAKLRVAYPSPSFVTWRESSSTAQVIREHYGLGVGYVILSLGRLVRRKGFATLIEAVAMLHKRGTDVTLAIAGDGPDRLRLQELAFSLGVTEQVRFIGEVESRELPGLFAACDSFVLAPRSEGADVEGFGIVYLEANMMAKPVIGTRTGGVPEAVIDGETGLLVLPSEPDMLADAILRLKNDPTFAAQLGLQGRKRAMEKFDAKLQMKPLADFLKDLAA